MTKKFLFLLVAVFYSLVVMADVRLPGIFGSNMVLQRNQPIPVWGWAAPGEKVMVQLNTQTAKTRAGKDGKWKLVLKQEDAGGPYKMIVTGKNEIVIDNILVGEVWLCSGQSNMEMYVSHSSDHRYAREIREANSTQIRHIKIPKFTSDTPVANISGAEWKMANDSNNVAAFTSVGYFFAKKLNEELNVPVGLINSSWGGTNVETWISREAVDTAQEFKGAVTTTFAQLKASASDGKVGPNKFPSLLFNAMINPLIPYAIRGALWYQGESNADRAAQYKKSFPMMISDWRSKWKQGDFPFYFVQLSSFEANKGNSRTGSTWAELREAQTATLAVPNTGMAVTIDIGDTKDIHPANKEDVGLRLAAIALAKQYSKPVEYSGPVFDRMSAAGNKVTVAFTHVDSGLLVKDKYGYLKGFELAGADQQWYYAKAEIEGSKVILHADSVAAPVAVRYGWADDMPEANLYNKQGLPAVPFRTDAWKGITENTKYKVQ